MTRPGLDIGDIKALLQADIAGLLARLCPDGYRSGRYWIARNPTRDDRRPGSFFVWMQGAVGAWKDEATGDKGDIISLVTYCLRLDGIAPTLEWARDYLGLERMDPARIKAVRARAQSDREAMERQRLQDLEQHRKYALGKWLGGRPQLEGTVAERYLAGRAIDLARLPRPPRVLRFLPAEPHRESGRKFPALCALMTPPEGSGACAIHRTWLAPDGSDKAPVAPARKIWPSFSGLVIKLARGETGLDVKAAAAQGLWDRLVLCEGVEDGLSLALACPEYRIWAAGSLGNLAHIRLPACCGEVIVAADNDWGKPQAERQLQAALTALARQGRPVKVARSHVGKDANDALRGTA